MAELELISRDEFSIVDLVSEGPIEGPVDKDGKVIQYQRGGGKNLYESVYLNGVPVKNHNDDSYNYRYVACQFRKGEYKQPSLSDISLLSKATNNEAIVYPFKTQTNITRIDRTLIGPYGDDVGSNSSAENNGAIPASFYIENPDVSKLTVTMLFLLSKIKRSDEDAQTIASSIKIGIEWAVEGEGFYNVVKADKMSISTAQVFNVDSLGVSSDGSGGGLGTSFGSNVVKINDGDFTVTGLSSTGARISFDIKLENEKGDYIDSNPDRKNRILKIYKLSGEGSEEEKGEANKNAKVDMITEHVDVELNYPGSAIISTTFDSRGFSGDPTRSFDLKLLKVKVPRNYTPWDYGTQRGKNLYKDNWDGTFAGELKWTSNPAWIFYDLLTNPKHGLGRFGIEEHHIDKWSLYEISRYCDAVDDDGLFVGLDDGRGGFEPRFSCNTLIEQKQDAYDLLYNLASVFNGMIYWGSGGVFTISDKPKDPVMFFSNSDVSEAGFIYSDSQKTTRITSVKTRYNDQYDEFKSKIEYAEDIDGIRKFGIIEKDLVAFGCTSRSQAKRLAKWVLQTSQRQRETITFTTGIKGLYLRPGDIFRIFDELDNEIKISGKIISINKENKTIKIDTPLIDSSKLTKIQVMEAKEDIPFDQIQTYEEHLRSRPALIKEYKISNIADDLLTLTLTELDGTQADFRDFDVGFSWIILDENAYPQEEVKLYKVINTKHEEDGSVTIMGLQHNEDKYNNVDSDKNLTTKKFELTSDIIKPKAHIADPSIKSFKAEKLNISSVVTDGYNRSQKILYKIIAEWYLSAGADSYEIRFFRDGISIPELTEIIIPSTQSIITDKSERFMRKVIEWKPLINKDYNISFSVSAIKDGRYSDAGTIYDNLP